MISPGATLSRQSGSRTEGSACIEKDVDDAEVARCFTKTSSERLAAFERAEGLQSLIDDLATRTSRSQEDQQGTLPVTETLSMVLRKTSKNFAVSQCAEQSMLLQMVRQPGVKK